MTNSIPEGMMRGDALKRIETLDCGNPDKTLASCDPAAKPPRDVLDWQKKLARGNVDDAAYRKALAIDGIHMDDDMTLVAAIGVDVNGDKHPMAVVSHRTAASCCWLREL
jgi:hypothetical protein